MTQVPYGTKGIVYTISMQFHVKVLLALLGQEFSKHSVRQEVYPAVFYPPRLAVVQLLHALDLCEDDMLAFLHSQRE
jgi:hypothetical protein